MESQVGAFGARDRRRDSTGTGGFLVARFGGAAADCCIAVWLALESRVDRLRGFCFLSASSAAAAAVAAAVAAAAAAAARVWTVVAGGFGSRDGLGAGADAMRLPPAAREASAQYVISSECCSPSRSRARSPRRLADFFRSRLLRRQRVAENQRYAEKIWPPAPKTSAS